MAEQERARLDIPQDAPASPVELAESATAKQVIANPATREFRAGLRERGYGVRSTVEIVSASALQAFSSGQINQDDSPNYSSG
jgi:hypothetical protein